MSRATDNHGRSGHLKGGGDPDTEPRPVPNDHDPRALADLIVNRRPQPPEGESVEPDRSDFYDQLGE